MNLIGAVYDGQRTTDAHRFNGLGQYVFSNGDVYVGGMKDGAFDGHGVIFFRTRRTPTGTAMDGGAVKETTADGATTTPTLKQVLAGATAGSAKSSSSAAAAAADGAHSEGVDEWSGHYRGFWENGTHIWGRYVFSDGLVYGSQPVGEARDATSSSLNAHTNDDKKARATREDTHGGSTSAFWVYCQSDDHRLWSEHLRHLAPVLPYETVLGGAKTNAAGIAARDASADSLMPPMKTSHTTNGTAAHQSPTPAPTTRLWVDMPVLVPSSRSDTLTPPSFAQGQPRSGADIPPAWWHNSKCHTRPSTANPSGVQPATEAAVPAATDGQKPTDLAALMALPTPPLLPEQDPDQIVKADGTVEVRSRRVDAPTLTLRFPHVEALLTTGGRVLVSQPCTDAQRLALKAWPNSAQDTAADGLSGKAVWARPASMASIAAVSAPMPSPRTTPRMTSPKTATATETPPSAREAIGAGTRPTAPRPPAQRPQSGSGSTVRSQQLQRQRAASPTPPAAAVAAEHVQQTPSQPNPSSDVPQLLMTLAPKASTIQPPSSDDGGQPHRTTANSHTANPTSASIGRHDDQDARSTQRSTSYSAPPPEVANNRTQCAADTHDNGIPLRDAGAAEAEGPELPSIEVPLIVLSTIPKVSQLSDESDEDAVNEAGETPLEVDDTTTCRTQAAITLQGFARMLRARRQRVARQEAVARSREADAREDDAEGEEVDIDADGAVDLTHPDDPFAVEQALAGSAGWAEGSEYESAEM